MRTKSAGPFAAVQHQYPLSHLEAGDRFTLDGELVEVAVRVENTGFYPPVQFGLSAVADGRYVPTPVGVDVRVDGVQLLADRARPDKLTLDFFGGGSYTRGRHDPLAVPLTLGGHVNLSAALNATHATKRAGQPLTVTRVFELRAEVETTGVRGKLPYFQQEAFDLWGRAHWDRAAAKLRSIGLLDEGLAPAGEALLAIATSVRIVEPRHAWVEAVAAATGIPHQPENLAVLLATAEAWKGTAAELLTTVNAATT